MNAYDVISKQDKLAVMTKWFEACRIALDTVDVLASLGYPFGEPCQAFDGYVHRRRWYGKQYIDINAQDRVLWPLNPGIIPEIRLKPCGASDLYLGDDGGFYMFVRGLGNGTVAADAFESADELDTVIDCLRNLQERARSTL